MREWAARTLERFHGPNGFYWGLALAAWATWSWEPFSVMLLILCLALIAEKSETRQ